MEHAAWPNGQGWDWRDWEITRCGSTWIAAERPAWFGDAIRRGTGPTWEDAMLNARPTAAWDDYVAATA